jgi:hypothetical protein
MDRRRGRGGMAAVVVGLAGAILGILHLATFSDGPGTGNSLEP